MTFKFLQVTKPATARENAIKIDGSVFKSQQDGRTSAEVATSITTIQERIRQLDALIAENRYCLARTETGCRQVNSAVPQADQVTRLYDGSAEESASASEELNA